MSQAAEPTPTRKWLWAIGATFGTMCLLCGLPIYGFFFHCPVDETMLEARRKIKVGMAVDEAKQLMPSGYSTHQNPKIGPQKAFSGDLWAFEVTSVQCTCTLVVTVDRDRVKEVKLIQYDDLSHNSWDVK